ncbi:MAG TPA: hypothetical protein PLZ57_09800 [Pseudobdellovibrionaceae bacterium]|nr:hypothetical protein [Pseudobdellovibrionaceae bacterium]
MKFKLGSVGRGIGVVFGVAALAMLYQNCSPTSNVGGESNSKPLVSSVITNNPAASPTPAGGASSSHLRGLIYGSCTMQLNANFTVAHNGSIDSSGAPLPNVPAGVGGATAPIGTCPNSGSANDTTCAAGYKPVPTSFVQMSTGTSYTYWQTMGCARTAPNSSSSVTYPQGVQAGNCTMQLNASFQIVHNGAIDSSGAPLSGVPIGWGGATWPVISCPNSGTNTQITCDTGWKPTTQHLVQMWTGSAYTYWAIQNCTKL